MGSDVNILEAKPLELYFYHAVLMSGMLTLEVTSFMS